MKNGCSNINEIVTSINFIEISIPPFSMNFTQFVGHSSEDKHSIFKVVKSLKPFDLSYVL